jgi:hypothetical protein
MPQKTARTKATRRDRAKKLYQLQLGAFLQQHRLPLLRSLLRNRDPGHRGRPREPPLLEALLNTRRQLPAQVAVVVEEAGAVGGREGEGGRVVVRVAGAGSVGGEDEAEEIADSRREGHAADARRLRARRRRRGGGVGDRHLRSTCH